MRVPRSLHRCSLMCLFALTAASPSLAQPLDSGRVIAGRVLDPHGVKTADTILMVAWGGDRTFASQPVVVAPDGRYRTPRLAPGVYVLELVRTPHSASAPATPIGVEIATLGGHDLTTVDVSARQDVWLEGRYVMDSADPAPVWPTFDKVLLDGVDVTDTPVDFSSHVGSRLEVVFTDRPRSRNREVGGVPGKGSPIEER